MSSSAVPRPPQWVTTRDNNNNAMMHHTVPHHANHGATTNAEVNRQNTTNSVVTSRILSSTPMDPKMAEDRVRVVEVPMVEEVTKHINVRRIVEREKHIPKIERTEIKKTIEIPKVTIVQKTVEVPRVKEVVKTVKVKKVVEVERELFKHVPKVEMKMIEKEVEVIGDVIEVPKPFLIENRVVVPRFVDNPVPTIVTQTLTPTFVESDEHVIEVHLKEYEPEVIPVDIFLPRPIDRNIAITGGITRSHVPIDIPLAHYNSLVLKLNSEREETSKLAIKRRLERRTSTSSHRSTSAGRSLTGQFVGSDEPTSDDETIDATFWIDHMLIPTATGAVPILHDEIDIVSPKGSDWMESYDETREYILHSNAATSTTASERCSSCNVSQQKENDARKTSFNRLVSGGGIRQKSEAESFCLDCDDCQRYRDHKEQFPTIDVDAIEFREGPGRRHKHLVELKSSE